LVIELEREKITMGKNDAKLKGYGITTKVPMRAPSHVVAIDKETRKKYYVVVDTKFGKYDLTEHFEKRTIFPHRNVAKKFAAEQSKYSKNYSYVAVKEFQETFEERAKRAFELRMAAKAAKDAIVKP